MENLKYRIGGLKDIQLELLKDAAWDDSYHFVVEGIDNVVSFYVAHKNSYESAVNESNEYNDYYAVAATFGIPKERVVGGGCCFVNGIGKLVLFNFCYTFGGIPRSVALEFAKLLVPELNKLGIEVDGIESCGVEVEGLYHPKRGYDLKNGHHMDSLFWMEKGFERGD